MSTTTESALLSWARHPSTDRAIRFAGPDGTWDAWPYPRLADALHRFASGLHASGLRSGDVVVLVEPTGPGFVTGYLGTMLAGGVPSPVTPPGFGQDISAYLGHVRHIVHAAAPRFVVTGSGLLELLRKAAGEVPVVGSDEVAAAGDPRPVGHRPTGLAMLQFTSGSTGRPRGVRVPYPALEHNVAAIGRWLRQRPEDPTASWLPMHHDMGLIGCLLAPIVHQTDLWLMRPEQFVRDPLRYLRCFGEHGARLTAMPTFGLQHIVRRVRPQQLSGMDFSAWRAVIVGAERVSHRALEDFWRLLAPYGLDRRSLLPAYGLAEATLAVTGVALDEAWSTVDVDPARMALGAPVAGAGPGAQPVVGCGTPLDGATVRILDEDGHPLPEGHVGEIEAGGPCVTAGYLQVPGVGTLTRFTGGTVRTGDIGFTYAGQLYLLGRLGDSLKLRGRTLFAEDVEAALEAAGLPRHRQAVLLGHTDRPMAVLLVEHADSRGLERARPVVSRLTEGAELVVLPVPVGTIMRTTSGKPRRRMLWQRFHAGELKELL